MAKWRFFSFGGDRGVIASREALADLLTSEASLIAQKTIVDYVHMKTRLPISDIGREKEFADAFEEARRAGFAAVLADLVATVEAHLRGPAGARQGDLPRALATLYAECRRRFGDSGAADDAAAESAALERRLAQLQLAAPKTSAEIAITSGNVLFDVLPIHPSLRKFDREPVVEGARFLFMSRCQRLGERLAGIRLVESLLAGDNGRRAPESATG